MDSGGFDWARRPTQVPPDCELLVFRPVWVRFHPECPPPQLEELERGYVAMDHRSHHFLEMDLEPVGEDGREVDDGVSVVSGQDEVVSLEEPVSRFPSCVTLHPRSVQLSGGWTRWMWRSCSPQC